MKIILLLLSLLMISMVYAQNATTTIPTETTTTIPTTTTIENITTSTTTTTTTPNVTTTVPNVTTTIPNATTTTTPVTTTIPTVQITGEDHIEFGRGEIGTSTEFIKYLIINGTVQNLTITISGNYSDKIDIIVKCDNTYKSLTTTVSFDVLIDSSCYLKVYRNTLGWWKAWINTTTYDTLDNPIHVEPLFIDGNNVLSNETITLNETENVTLECKWVEGELLCEIPSFVSYVDIGEIITIEPEEPSINLTFSKSDIDRWFTGENATGDAIQDIRARLDSYWDYMKRTNDNFERYMNTTNKQLDLFNETVYTVIYVTNESTMKAMEESRRAGSEGFAKGVGTVIGVFSVAGTTVVVIWVKYLRWGF